MQTGRYTGMRLCLEIWRQHRACTRLRAERRKTWRKT